MDYFFIFFAQYLFLLSVFVLGLFFFLQVRSVQKRILAFALPAVFLTFALSRIGGYMYFNPRPFVTNHLTPLVAHAADNGFPSDHTLLVATLAMIGLYWHRKLGFALWIITILVAIARVYVGVHHPIDVIGSMAFALLGVSMTYVLLK